MSRQFKFARPAPLAWPHNTTVTPALVSPFLSLPVTQLPLTVSGVEGVLGSCGYASLDWDEGRNGSVSGEIDIPGVGPFGAAQYAPTLYRVWMPVKERLAQGDKPQRSEASALNSARHMGPTSRLVTARVAAACTAYRDSVSTSSGSTVHRATVVGQTAGALPGSCRRSRIRSPRGSQSVAGPGHLSA